MIEALKANRDASLESMQAAHNLTDFLWGLTKASLETVPGIAQLVSAVDHADQQIAKEIPNIQKIAGFIERVERIEAKRIEENIEDAEFEIKAIATDSSQPQNSP